MVPQFHCRFEMLGQLQRQVAIGSETGEKLGQQSELVAREHSEQRIVDGALKGSEPRQQAETLAGDGELDPATVARMRALLDETVEYQLFDFIGDEDAAQMQPGRELIDPDWAVLLIAYVLSAALAGLGDAIAGFAIGRVVPEFAFWTASGHLVLVAIPVGIGGVPGAFIGALFLELLHTTAVTVTDAWNLIVGSALIVVIMFMPKGLYGFFAREGGADR